MSQDIGDLKVLLRDVLRVVYWEPPTYPHRKCSLCGKVSFTEEPVEHVADCVVPRMIEALRPPPVKRDPYTDPQPGDHFSRDFQTQQFLIEEVLPNGTLLVRSALHYKHKHFSEAPLVTRSRAWLSDLERMSCYHGNHNEIGDKQ